MAYHTARLKRGVTAALSSWADLPFMSYATVEQATAQQRWC